MFDIFAKVKEIDATINTLGKVFTTATILKFVGGVDPFLANLIILSTGKETPCYLSEDLRLLTVTPGIDSDPLPNLLAPQFLPTKYSIGGAYDYLSALLAFLNATYNDTNSTRPLF